MDETRFDRWTRRLDASLSRRRFGGVVAGVVAAFGLVSEGEAKKKKKKKKKEPAPICPAGANHCAGDATSCGLPDCHCYVAIGTGATVCGNGVRTAGSCANCFPGETCAVSGGFPNRRCFSAGEELCIVPCDDPF